MLVPRVIGRQIQRNLGSNLRVWPRFQPRSFVVGFQARFNSSSNDKSASIKTDPQLMIAFTCKKCNTRSSHTFSKQAYTKGTVAIQCSGCHNRHLIADNLKIFADNRFNLQEYLNARGEDVANDTGDLVFEDIPESLKSTLGHYAKNAPPEYQKQDSGDNSLPEPEQNEKSKN